MDFLREDFHALPALLGLPPPAAPPPAQPPAQPPPTTAEAVEREAPASAPVFAAAAAEPEQLGLF
jgi:hypothetical protein